MTFLQVDFSEKMVESERAREDQWSVSESHAHELLSMSESSLSERDSMALSAAKSPSSSKSSSDGNLGIAERAFSAAGAAFLSAIIVNPLDVAKVNKFCFVLFFF